MFAANLRLLQQDGLCHGKFNTPSSHIKDSKKKMLTIAFRQSKTPNKPTREVTRKKTVLFYQTIAYFFIEKSATEIPQRVLLHKGFFLPLRYNTIS